MQAPPVPENEKQRLKELYQYAILDSDTEKEFDDLVQLASKICNVPISLVSLVDSDRQWFKAKVGLPVSETKRDYSFCAHSFTSPEDIFIVPDASKDLRFHDNPLVTADPEIRFYAGVPLVSPNGYKMGTLCVIDKKPRELDAEQKFALETLAQQVVSLMNLRLRNKELQRINVMQNKLISIVAHDVRNPLASLKGIIELRQTDIITDEEADEMLGLASGQLEATIDMVANLIDWGKLQMRSDNSFVKNIDLAKTINTSVAGFKNLIEEKNIACNVDVASASSAATDETAFNFILRNLISNAIKYTENGTINISVEPINDQLKLIVADSGTGFDKQTLDTLFQQHKHYPVPGTRNEPGSGLALSLIKDLLDKTNGTIDIQTEPKAGTTVTVVF
jgi:signal transduction histidine kinase